MADRLPLRANVRWFQLAFGAFAGILLHQLVQHARGVTLLATGGLVLRVLGLLLGLLVFVVYLQNVHRFGLVPDYAKKCRFCNGPVNRYSEFCEHCGADLIAPEKLLPCPRCGVDVYEGTKFCPECGANVARAKKPKKTTRERQAPPPDAGWDEPLDAVNPPPWERER